MAESTGFTHITVTPDEDDDIVIQAGIVAEEPVGDEAPADGMAAAPAEGGPVSEEVVPEPLRETAKEPAPAPVPRPSKSDDGYRETSFEDLQGMGMTTTQKVVIIAAVLGIVAFVAWYLFAR